MAFIKPNPRNNAIYYNVVEGVYEDGQTYHNQVLYLGRLDNLTPKERREFEVDLTEIDPSLLSDFYDLLVKHDYNFEADTDYQSQYPLEEITPKQAVDYGPVAALHAIGEKLGVESVLDEQLQPKGGGPPLGKLYLLQSIAHCLEPRSIDATTDWYPLTALPGLLDFPDEQLTSDILYNSLDYVDQDGIERVHEELWTRVHELYDTPEEPVFYDLTSSYFEGTQCPLSKYGYSSENRPDKQQIVMGVAVNPDMVPLHHDVYPGNTNHTTTVDDVANRVDEFGISDPVLVMDKGCATKSKRKRLRGEDSDVDFDPIDYVAALKNYNTVTQPLAELAVTEFDQVELPDGASPLAVREIEPPDDLDSEQIRWIATYNVQKAADDAEYRSDCLEKAGKALDKLVERQEGKRPLAKQELLDRIEKKLKKHSVQDMVTVEVNERGPPRLSWGIDDQGVMEDARLDGKAMFETTRAAERLSAAAVARAYRDRDTVEKFMESIKDVARLRPHHVYTEQHVRARVLVCVLSVLLIAVLQLELEEAGKEMTGMKALETLRGVRRVEFSAGSDEAVVVKTTELSNEQEELAHVFDLGT
jgi:transposase